MKYPIYVVQQGARVNLDNRRVQVSLHDESLLQEPVHRVSQLVLFGNVQVTTQTITALLNKDAEIIYLSYHGSFRGRTVGETTPHVPLRRAQYRALDDPAYQLAHSQAIVRAKLQHQLALLRRHGADREDAVIQAAIQRLAQARDQVESRASLASLRGHEGAAARAYFGGYRRLFGPEWHFEARRRRPPPDPINVLLSLGYTLLSQAAFSAVHTVGLDPYAGCFHDFKYNRPTMALDLMEEFRPVIDGLILWVVNSGQITPAHFESGPSHRPVILNEEGKRRYLAAYEQRMMRKSKHPLKKKQLTLRQSLIEQARQIATRLMRQDPGYTGMGFR
jgi:CRISPR-associated protein Cas1